MKHSRNRKQAYILTGRRLMKLNNRQCEKKRYKDYEKEREI